MLRIGERRERLAIPLAISFVLIYILFIIEALFPLYLPEFSLILLIVLSLRFPPTAAAILGFFLGFLSDHLSMTLFGRYALFFTALALALSSLKRYIIPSYPYLLFLIFSSLLLKNILGGFNLIKSLLTLMCAIPFIRILRQAKILGV